ncbi:asparagine synthase [Colletotrichum tofieldiae]|uniref:Asparagine synthase n=1 Tax=Colletotrichum tofieldiae TaxID=708197 RepID=A0A166Z6M6_9PEZI|nr:asparagine synthase [Colletotrichum tofieldiae]GKT53870.1 asparagine synthase [Colletotrichum tofieldiae]GKT73610.1 asparagine synthase [Colletotrichum tofieldiae]GKT95557.1 asparagine synthase [Colletotrichum tofieldiae]
MAGIQYGPSEARPDIQDKLTQSPSLLRYCGPDATVTWIISESTIGTLSLSRSQLGVSHEHESTGLGHARLCIADLFSTGFADGRAHVSVKGEIYDHDAIRACCVTEHGYRFSGWADSEVIPNAVPAPRRARVSEANARRARPHLARCVGGRDSVNDGHGFPVRTLAASGIKAFLPMGWQPEWDVAAVASGATA